MTPPSEDNKTTGEREAIAAEKAVRKVLAEQERGSTPTHGTPKPNAEDIERRAHYQLCENEKGAPACKLNERIDDIEKEIAAMKLAKAKEDGVNSEIAKHAAKSTALQTLLISGAIGFATMLGGFALSRLWPPPAQAQPVQVQGAHP